MGHTVGKGEIEDDCLDIGLNNGKTRVAIAGLRKTLGKRRFGGRPGGQDQVSWTYLSNIWVHGTNTWICVSRIRWRLRLEVDIWESSACK